MYLVSFDFYSLSKCGSYFCRTLYKNRVWYCGMDWTGSGIGTGLRILWNSSRTFGFHTRRGICKAPPTARRQIWTCRSTFRVRAKPSWLPHSVQASTFGTSANKCCKSSFVCLATCVCRRMTITPINGISNDVLPGSSTARPHRPSPDCCRTTATGALHAPLANRLAIAGKTVLNNSSTEPEAHVRHPMHCFLKLVLETMNNKMVPNIREFLRYVCIAFRVYRAEQPQHAICAVEGSMVCNACRWLYRFAGHHGSEWSPGTKKGKPQVNHRKLFVVFRDKSGNNLTIRHHSTYSSAL